MKNEIFARIVIEEANFKVEMHMERLPIVGKAKSKSLLAALESAYETLRKVDPELPPTNS